MNDRLLAVDLDNTLLDRRNGVNATARRAVQLAQDHGVIVCIATGRTYQSACRFSEKVGALGPVIANNGAVICSQAGEFLYEKILPNETVKRILYNTQDVPYLTYIYAKEGVYVRDPEGVATPHYARALEIEIKSDSIFRHHPNPRIYGLSFRIPSQNAEQAEHWWRKQLPEDVQVVSTVPTLLEVLPKHASKGRALRWLSKQYHIPRESVFAIGDGRGDLDMIAFAGVGMLVANADPSLYHYADHITCAPYAWGVLELVENYILSLPASN